MHAGLGRLQLLAQQTPQLGQLGTFQVRRHRDEPVRNRIDHPRHARRARTRERDAQEVAAQVGRNAESVAQTAGSVAQRRDTVVLAVIVRRLVLVARGWIDEDRRFVENRVRQCITGVQRGRVHERLEG